jgi:hypothetical protein
VRDAVAGVHALWRHELRVHIRRAVHNEDLPGETDPDQLVFELLGIMLSLNHFLQLPDDPAAPARARRAVGRLLTG